MVVNVKYFQIRYKRIDFFGPKTFIAPGTLSIEMRNYYSLPPYFTLPAKRRRISGRRFAPSEGEKRRPEIRLRFVVYTHHPPP